MNDNKFIVEVENLAFRYNGESVLEDISLSVEAGDFLGIVGPNGGGKTTLLKIILGLYKPMAGSVRVLGELPHKVCSKIGYTPQQANIDKHFPINVFDVVLLGLLNESRYFGRYPAQTKRTVERALQEVDLYELRYRRFGTLSGGERQRALIARALVGEPKLLIMDEPTSNVDSWSQNQIYEILKRINARCTIILVSHDLGVVSTYVKHVACLNRRLVIHPTQEFTGETIEAMYRTPIHLVNHGMEI